MVINAQDVLNIAFESINDERDVIVLICGMLNKDCLILLVIRSRCLYCSNSEGGQQEMKCQ